MGQTAISVNGVTWLTLSALKVRGEGKLQPRLIFDVEARTPRENMEIHVHQLQARLLAAGETVGYGTATGFVLGWHGQQVPIDIPISREALDFVDDKLTGDNLALTLELSGALWCKDNNEDGPLFASAPTPGAWYSQPFGRTTKTELPFEIPRSDWYSRIRGPLGTVDYLSLEVPIARSFPGILASVNQVAEADRQLAIGHEPGVFFHCKAAIDALPGWPKEIFASLADQDEAKALDDLLKYTGEYLHRGRHVATKGELDGTFAVTGRDARFALNLTKVLISHTAALVGPAS